jgi:predicted phosphohydrolase
MGIDVRFAIASDLHIGLPHTIWEHPSRFHLVEYSIPALEVVFEQLSTLELDFLLIPGDLTQHGERDNHAWLGDRLSQLPYPAYVIPGNHDLLATTASDGAIAAAEFPQFYRHAGYKGDRLYYTTELAPGLRLIGLNSITFDEQGQQRSRGSVDDAQLAWLADTLRQSDDYTLVMIHHNVVEHLPGQAEHPFGQRYLLENAPQLRQVLRDGGVQLVFTGHLHVQDIAQHNGLYDITTGSLVSYPHPFRVLRLQQSADHYRLSIESTHIATLPEMPDLQAFSRQWMGDRSFPFMMKLLTYPPFNIPATQAEPAAPHLRDFWAEVSKGDAQLQFPMLPDEVREPLERFSARDADGNYAPIDNQTTLTLPLGDRSSSLIFNKISRTVVTDKLSRHEC